MITAVDTNVLLDVFLADDRHGNASKAQMMSAYRAGALIASEIVYAELVPAFAARDLLDRALREINVRISPLSADIAFEAGLRWMRYRRAGGSRERILPDFLIGAHALLTADKLLTRDRGFYRNYFPEI